MISDSILQLLDAVLNDTAYARFLLQRHNNKNYNNTVVDSDSGNTIAHILAYSDLHIQLQLILGSD